MDLICNLSGSQLLAVDIDIDYLQQQQELQLPVAVVGAMCWLFILIGQNKHEYIKD